MESKVVAGGLPPCVTALSFIVNLNTFGSGKDARLGKLSWRQDCLKLHPLRRPFMRKKRAEVSAAAVDTAFSAKPVTSTTKSQVEDVVIVGGGIAGFATALALHRLGIRSVLLEQSKQLRTAGTTIGLWSNAWKALEALGVADSLRSRFIKLLGVEFFRDDGGPILSIGFDEASRDVELRGVERKALLETLREPLPDEYVFYNCQVTGIKQLEGGYTQVQCRNGRTILTKVLIGCDGVGSVVAKCMNMGEPHFAGYAAIRGLAEYPDGHNLSPTAKQMLGRGVRTGIAPMDANRAYWFVVFNSTDERVTNLEQVRAEALNFVQGWSSMITEAINRSPLDSFSRRGIADRWMWPIGGPSHYKGGVTLAGDAMHPMTPNLGQGGCCALEDAVILARALSKALMPRDSPALDRSAGSQAQEMAQIELALKSYSEERWPRVLPLAVRSYFTGALLQVESEMICSLRNKMLPRILKVDRFLDHTYYDCGTLR